MRINNRISLLLAATLLCACGSTTHTVPTTEAPAYEGAPVRNILVIGRADSYENRTRYERRLAASLRQAGTQATAYFVATGGNTPIEREAVEQLAREQGFDGVLISRATNRDADATLKTGSASAKATRRDAGKPLDLFRYDYEELNEPEMLDVRYNMTILSELFVVPEGDKVWSVETTVSDVETLVAVINETSDAVVARLQKDGVIGSD